MIVLDISVETVRGRENGQHLVVGVKRIVDALGRELLQADMHTPTDNER